MHRRPAMFRAILAVTATALIGAFVSAAAVNLGGPIDRGAAVSEPAVRLGPPTSDPNPNPNPNPDPDPDPDPDPNVEGGTVLFVENFDEHPDWVSTSDDPPERWFAYRATPAWAPSTGHPDRNEGIEILASNTDMARGGTGKSAVFWRESLDGPFHNDKLMAYKTAEDQDRLYVEFWLTFDPNWTTAGNGPNTNKMFRIYAFDDQTPGTRIFRYFPSGDNGPIFFHNYTLNPTFGLRNFVGLRGGPFGENYYMTRPQGWPRQVNNGDSSLNFVSDQIGQGVNGSTPQIPDRVNGGALVDDPDGIISHEQLFGPPSQRRWTKLAYYVEMNSSPGVADGVLRQWINDVQVIGNTNMVWMGPTQVQREVNWNIVALGGNDFFSIQPDSARHKEWYAIDDLVIRTEIPDGLR